MRFRQSATLYIYSTPHIVGCGLAMVALALFFIGFIDSFWYGIVAGCYGIGVLVTPANKGVLIDVTQQMNAEELTRQLQLLIENATSRLTNQVKAPLADIQLKIEQILPLLDKRSVTQDLHTVKQVIVRYLPDMLDSYLKLPPAYARFHLLRSGKTPRDELVAQLTILQGELDTILGNLLTDDVNALRAHGQFLKEKYQARNPWLS